VNNEKIHQASNTPILQAPLLEKLAPVGVSNFANDVFECISLELQDEFVQFF